MSGGFANAVYYPSWIVYKGKPPSSLNVTQASHVLYSFVGKHDDDDDDDGLTSIKAIDEWADTGVEADGEKGCLAALAKLKRSNPHLKTLVSIGGGTGSAQFPAMAANPQARETFARAIRAFVEQHELDGVDIDWEHPKNAREGNDFLHLLYTIRTQLPGPRYLLTTALPPGEWVLRNIDLAQAAQYLDLLNLMAYDLTGAWTPVAGHQAQLRAPAHLAHHDCCRAHCAAGVDYCLRQGFPGRKILLGVPAYARYFPGAQAAGHPFSDAGEMNYCDFPAAWVEQARVDEEAAAAWHVDPDKGFASFDTPASVRIKARWVRERQLGGLMYWTGSADRPGRESLVSAGYLEMHGYAPL
ncbi:hypothetical protein D7B24_007929 [Verticillium nonalfalfae]|uniref:chitinase n=1 Tax=Verticillium nonalfalfae TaxID=1051616 RepID=A0A3M9Y6S4_9PEZI|nr:uncharacterized protein D7B24_007929 [Verticillium nonalfalfae]RNJ55931.1 hypothetical protein D7B24_007929 [Verticillium nonalfalfae]